MSEKICKWMKDEICVNDQCPMCADYCPTAQYPGVCKYEELVEVKEEMTIGKCFIKALEDVGINVPFEKAVEALNRFRELIGNMNEDCRQAMEEADSGVKNQYAVGQILYRAQVENSPLWQCKSSSCKPNDDSCCYLSNDERWVIRFHNGYKVGTVAPWHKDEDFVVGRRVHIGAISESVCWICVDKGEKGSTYETKDGQLAVDFDDNSDWGTILLNKSQNVPHECGGVAEGDSVRMIDLEMNPQWHKTKVACHEDYETVAYVSEDGVLAVYFEEDDTELDICTVRRIK